MSPVISWIDTNDPSQTTNSPDDLVNPPADPNVSSNPWMAVTNFTAKSNNDGSGIVLTWKNPEHNMWWYSTWIIKRRFGFVNTPIDLRGELIYFGEGETFTDTNIIPGEVYYYVGFGVSEHMEYLRALSGLPTVRAFLTDLNLDTITTEGDWYGIGRKAVQMQWGWGGNISQKSILAVGDHLYTSLMYGDL